MTVSYSYSFRMVPRLDQSWMVQYPGLGEICWLNRWMVTANQESDLRVSQLLFIYTGCIGGIDGPIDRRAAGR